MALERTFSIIKPDATRRNLTGKINAKFEEAGLRIVAQKRIHMTKEQAGVFYGVHAERPFYDELCEFMSSEPVRGHGRNQPCRRSPRHHPRRVRGIRWRKLCPRFRRTGNRSG